MASEEVRVASLPASDMASEGAVEGTQVEALDRPETYCIISIWSFLRHSSGGQVGRSVLGKRPMAKGVAGGAYLSNVESRLGSVFDLGDASEPW